MDKDSPVLIIDDDHTVLRGLRRTLSPDFSIEICDSGESAIATIASGLSFSVIICDQKMEGLSGIETLEILQKKAPTTPRILLTGHANSDNLRHAINRAQLFRIIEKPCSKEALIKAITDAKNESYRLEEKHKALEKAVLANIKMLQEIMTTFKVLPSSHRVRIRALAYDLIEKTNVCPFWVIDAALMLSSLDKLFECAHAGEKTPPDKAAALDFGPKLVQYTPRMKPVSEALHFKEKGFDGSGHPTNLIAGKTIPIEGRLLFLLLKFERLLDDEISEKDALKSMGSSLYKNTFDPTLLSELSEIVNQGQCNATDIQDNLTIEQSAD